MYNQRNNNNYQYHRQQQRRQQQQQQQQQFQITRLPDPNDMGSLIVRGTVHFAKKNKVITGSYILGIIVLLLAGSGTKLSLEQRKQYNNIMSTIDIEAEYDASEKYYRSLSAYRASKGWFTCDSLCQRNKQRMDHAKLILDDIRNEGNARMSDAKSIAGLFSEIGVSEVKDTFWSYFNHGKKFAQRQSMWDAMFIGFRSMSRDESMVEYMLKMLFQVLINFSLGLIIALVVFIFSLWNIVRDYQPNPIVAVIFFILVTCAAFSFVITYLLTLYGAAAGGLYGLAKLAESSQHARIQDQQRQQQYMNNRPHY